MSMLPSAGPQVAERDLALRLDALAELTRIGRAWQARAGGGDDGPGFSPALLDGADAVLKRAGERLRLSGSHTVVALAGGTGSGKSTLFNTLSGATFSPPGVTRPTTRHVHACVWGMQGAAPLLDWLGVQRRHRFARASVLDSGESDLDGLILLDLPDHDSVVTASLSAVDRLSRLADMVIWVLDPQKYADAAVHNRYLIPLAGHAAVFAVVLNQVDTLPPQQARDCEEDLERLLEAEGLADAPVLPVSARTGTGLEELRALLAGTVSRNRAAGMRIAADIDGLIDGFAAYDGPRVVPDPAGQAPGGPVPPGAAASPGPVSGAAIDGIPGGAVSGAGPAGEDELLTASPGPGALGPSGSAGAEPSSLPPWELADEADDRPAVSRPPWEDATPDGGRAENADPSSSVPPEPAGQLAAALARAAGVTAVAQAMASAREARTARLGSWPPGRVLRAGRGQVPALRAGGDAGLPAAAAGLAQQSEVDNAITAFAGEAGGPLPEPWAGGLREAARYNAGKVPQALAEAVRGAAEDWPGPPGPWRLVVAWQWLLTVLAVAGIALAVVIAVVRLTGHRQGWISEASLIPWIALMVLAMLVLGYVTAVTSRNMAATTAARERAAAERAMHDRVGGVTRDLVLAPAGREIDQYERFRQELAVASGKRPA